MRYNRQPSFLIQARSKPPEERRRTALMIAGMVTGMMMIGWAYQLPDRFDTTERQIERLTAENNQSVLGGLDDDFAALGQKVRQVSASITAAVGDLDLFNFRPLSNSKTPEPESLEFLPNQPTTGSTSEYKLEFLPTY